MATDDTDQRETGLSTGIAQAAANVSKRDSTYQQADNGSGKDWVLPETYNGSGKMWALLVAFQARRNLRRR